MTSRSVWLTVSLASVLAACAAGDQLTSDPDAETATTLDLARRDRGLHKVKHVIVLMQENHSFDNYFGALAFAPGSPYHGPRHHRDDGDGDADDRGGCRANDHRCVDGLSCQVDAAGNFDCTNANLDDDGSTAFAFHDSNRCVSPDLDHEWVGTHREVNFDHPSDTRRHAPMNGFVRVNDENEQPDGGVETPTDDDTMGFYNQDEIPFYYELASKFAISDRFFSSLLGPTFPNRSYLLAATSFGHLTTSDEIPPDGGYKPITGTIFDLLERNDVSWADYFQDAPQGASFRPFLGPVVDPHFLPLPVFLAQAAGATEVGPLPAVSFVDPSFGLFGISTENDEHPPTDIQRGQAFVSQVVNAVRNGPFWDDTVIFITWDEHGGFYDHVAPPRAHQPDGIAPGQCADLSNPPASLQPGGGAECNANVFGDPRTSVFDAIQLCHALAADPTGPYPRECANFDQLGVRVPFIAISPFAKRNHVSHTVADHTSILAFIEAAFAPGEHLTQRDRHANDLLDLFDFAGSPSRDVAIGTAAPPTNDCTPVR